jgi:hypothetical protein
MKRYPAGADLQLQIRASGKTKIQKKLKKFEKSF